MDVYHRLTGDEGDFFLPFDLELSLQELSYICRYYNLKRKEERSGKEKEAIKRKEGGEGKQGPVRCANVQNIKLRGYQTKTTWGH